MKPPRLCGRCNDIKKVAATISGTQLCKSCFEEWQEIKDCLDELDLQAAKEMASTFGISVVTFTKSEVFAQFLVDRHVGNRLEKLAHAVRTERAKAILEAYKAQAAVTPQPSSNSTRAAYTGTYDKSGSTWGYRGFRKPTFLLTDVHSNDLQIARIWLYLTKAFEALDLQPGDVVSFEARLEELPDGSLTLSRPTRVSKIPVGE